MKTLLPAISLFVMIPSAAQSSPSPESVPPPLSAAVFDFTDGAEHLQGQGKSVAELLNAFLSTQERVILVERAELEKILSEQELGLAGAVSADNAVQIGQLTGAQLLVTGRVFQAGNKTYAVAKVISAETSRVYGASASYASTGELENAVKELSDKIADIIRDKGDTMRSKTETFEQMVARLKDGLGANLPKIYVHVTEEHLRQAVPDPACETELRKILDACGFELATHVGDADISVTGEAFSQLATRRGNMVACRARAEIKITDVKENKPIRVARVTVGAIDLAEEVAGKAALQKAGLELAEDIILNLPR